MLLGNRLREFLRSMTLSGAAAIACAMVVASADAAVVRYRVVLLPALNGGSINEALSINSAGVVGGKSGTSTVNPGQHAVIWADDTVHNLDSIFNLSEASVINDAGAIAGPGTFCPPINGPCTGTIARALPGGAFVTVGTLGGPNGEVRDINAAGDFVGWWSSNGFAQTAFRHTEATGVLSLGTLGGFASNAVAINDTGDIAGTSYTASLQRHAFRWRDGVMLDLGTLGGTSSDAADMNQAGVIVGTTTTAKGALRAFRTTANDALQDLQTLPQAISSSALVINDAGMIGGIWNDGTSDRLFIHTEALGMVDIGKPIEDFFASSASIALNDAGRMIGVGSTSIYQPVAWFWSPEAGLQTLDSMLANGSGLEVIGVGGINDAGQIAATVRSAGQSNQRAARLDPVAPADLNADGNVDVADLLGVITAWGSANAIADVNGSGIVEVGDLIAVIAAWG